MKVIKVVIVVLAGVGIADFAIAMVKCLAV